MLRIVRTFTIGSADHLIANEGPRLSSPRMLPVIADLGCLRTWLQECDTHPRAVSASLGGVGSGGFAFRVYDCLNAKVVVLREPRSYVALSYVWGARSNEHADRQTRLCSLDTTDLPATIADAIALTRAIGRRYIWVDSLCIEQSESDEVTATVANMGAIYKNAYLTIIAASGSDVHAGLSRLHKLSDGQTPHHAISFQTRGVTVTAMVYPNDLSEVWKECTWASRGWTYQEYVMSERIVIFTKNEMFFQSSHGTRRREAYEPISSNVCPNPTLPPSITQEDDGWLHEADDLQAYQRAVCNFSPRVLTFRGDRYDAFAGVMNSRFAQDRSGHVRTALNGLSPNSFYPSLSW